MGQPEHQQSSFAESDSGSFVVDIEGKVCGLLYGATSGLYGPPGKTHCYANAGLAIALPDLKNSIRLRTVPRDDNGFPSWSPAELGLPGQEREMLANPTAQALRVSLSHALLGKYRSLSRRLLLFVFFCFLRDHTSIPNN